MIISYQPTANDGQIYYRIYGTWQKVYNYLRSRGYVLFTTTEESYWVRGLGLGDK